MALLDSMTSAVENNKKASHNENGLVELLIYRFDYLLPINNTGTYIKYASVYQTIMKIETPLLGTNYVLIVYAMIDILILIQED